jgi:glycosyltransferase involved in cell wall biosynthesis
MRVTVIILTYNHEKFIAQAITSALMQESDFAYEIVIVEDCSTDRTRDIVTEFQKRHSKIRLVLAETNQNDNRAWGREISNARGSYVALLDGDDYWTSPHKLQKQADFMDSHPECAICFHNVTAFHEDRSREPYNFNPVDQKVTSTIEDLWASDFMATCSVMLRRDLVGHLPEWYSTLPFGDWPLYILAALKGNIGYINEVMGAYRIHGGGAWSGSSSIQQEKSLVKCYTTMDAQLDFAHHRSIRSHLSKRYYKLALEYENISDFANAKKCAVKSIVEDPFNGRIPRSHLFAMLLRLYAPMPYRLISAVRKAFNPSDSTP